MPNNGGGMDGFAWMLIVVAVAAVALVVFVATDRRAGSADDTEALLRERFAHGEIDERELRERLAAVPSGPHGPLGLRASTRLLVVIGMAVALIAAAAFAAEN